MTVKKTPNGGWKADVEARTPSGEIVRRRRRSKKWTRRDAQRWERDVRRKIEAGTLAREEAKVVPPRLADYWDEYVRNQVDEGIKPSTLRSKDSMWRVWIRPMFESRRIDSFKTSDFSKLRAAMLDAARSPKRVNNVLTCLSAFVRHWHREHDLPLPGFRTKLCKVPRNTDANYYREEELARMVEVAEGPRLAALLLGADAGLRLGEVAALRWSDLTFGTRPAVRVSRSRDRSGVELTTKGWGARSVPMTERLAAALRGLPRNIADDHVVLRDSGQPLSERTLARWITAAKKAAGVNHGSFHTLRHTFCSYLAMRGVSPVAVRQLAGHQHITTTERYMHLAPSAKSDAIRVLDPRQHRGTAEDGKTKTGS